MMINRTVRRLVFGSALIGAISFSGCATTQTVSMESKTSSTPITNATPVETPVQKCQKTWRTKVYDCIIEKVVSSCRERNQSSEDEFYSCISKDLMVPQAQMPSEKRQMSVAVTAGDEVFSMISGGPVVVDVARLEATTVDVNGVTFTFTIERIATAAPNERKEVQQTNVRFNFNGTTTGDVWKLMILPIWNFRVQTVASDRATVSFETNEPTVLVRPVTLAEGQAQTETADQKKK